jgi:hypothetical protein
VLVPPLYVIRKGIESVMTVVENAQASIVDGLLVEARWSASQIKTEKTFDQCGALAVPSKICQ